MTMYAEERQQEMARRVAEHGRLSVNELADLYAITTETVRRDLTALEALGLVRRVHGGAIPAGTLTTLESALVERDTLNTAAKERIARAAVDLLVGPGTSVVFDAGSTTARLAGIATGRPPGHGLYPRLAGRRAAQRAVRGRRTPSPRPGASHHPGRRRCRHRGRARADPRRPGVRRDQRHLRPRAEHARPRRGHHQTGADRDGPAGGPARRSVEVRPRQRDALRRAGTHVDVLVTDAEPPAEDRAALARADVRVVVA